MPFDALGTSLWKPSCVRIQAPRGKTVGEKKRKRKWVLQMHQQQQHGRSDATRLGVTIVKVKRRVHLRVDNERKVDLTSNLKRKRSCFFTKLAFRPFRAVAIRSANCRSTAINAAATSTNPSTMKLIQEWPRTGGTCRDPRQDQGRFLGHPTERR